MKLRYVTSTAVLLIAMSATSVSAQTQDGVTNQPSAQDGLSQSDERNQASRAQGECQVIQEDFEAQVLDDPERRATFGPAMVRDLRSMRDTAVRLEHYGQTEACNEVANAIYEIMENPEQGAQAAQDGGMQTGSTGQQQDQQAQATDQADGQDQATQDQSMQGQTGQGQTGQGQTEQTVAWSQMQGQIRADQIIGADVRDIDNQSVGEVDDILIAGDDSSNYLVVAYGGFLGLGEGRSAVPTDSVRVSQDGDIVYVSVSQDQLENAPTFQEGDYAWFQDEEWRQQNEQFYQPQDEQTQSD